MALRVFVVCFAFLMSALPVFGTAAFAGDPYTVSNVHVDAQADNALEAQTLAISEGYVEAANVLINRLSLERERMAKGFVGVSEIDSKKMSQIHLLNCRNILFLGQYL